MHYIYAAYCYARHTSRGQCIAEFVSLLSTPVSPAKTAEMIEMPFVGQTHTGSREHASAGDTI